MMKEFVTAQQVTSNKQLDQLKDFLRVNQLPVEDIRLGNGLYLAYYNSVDELVGSGGMEFYGDRSLLRSLAVSQGLRGQALGQQIVRDLIGEAKIKGVHEVFLLTQTAFFFFLKLGFKEVDRKDVPPAIRASTEFSQVCPSSAHVMKLVLDNSLDS
jgi:amino-acid N-acetyltransferase